MSRRSDIDLLDDILVCMQKIQSYIAGFSYDDFESDLKTQDAIIRNIEVIGEATKKLSGDLRREYHNVPWKAMAGMRDRLIHGYFGVNIDIIWEVATLDIPGLRDKIERIKNDLSD